ncbi:MAG: LLM class flavin-dependent oxidoreductase [Acidimicrobiales bacterium]
MTGRSVELVLSPFGADARAMVAAAVAAEDAGLAGVWTFDHLTGSMLGRGWSREPFSVLGAMATATEAVRLGPMVANMMNRHPVQLAVAMATVQSLSAGRAVLGLGAGAAPGSAFAGEHGAIGITLLDSPGRRRRLAETVAAYDAVWQGEPSYRAAGPDGSAVTYAGLDHLVGPEPRPPVIIGAGSLATLYIALDWADGVNLLAGPRLAELADRVVEDDRTGQAGGFEVTVFVEAGAERDGGARGWSTAFSHPAVTSVLVGIRPPYDHALIAELGGLGGPTPRSSGP